MRKLLATAVLTAISFSANAVPVEWTLNNFVFEDGGIATGAFTFDADNYELSNFSIVTSGGEMTGNTYDMYYLAVGNHDIGTTIVANANTFPARIQFDFIGRLTNAGGIISFADEFSDGFTRENYVNDGLHRDFVSGTISAIPVPAAVWLFGSALAGLGFMRRRQIA